MLMRLGNSLTVDLAADRALAGGEMTRWRKFAGRRLRIGDGKV
jgi:hypothetical protein